MKAATGGGNTAVAVRGANTSCFITQKKVQVCYTAHLIYTYRDYLRIILMN